MEKPRVECQFHWQQSGEFEAFSDADCGGDKVTQRSVSAGVTKNCLKLWAKSSRWCFCPLLKAKLYAAVKAASEEFGIQSVAKDLGIVCGVNLYLDATVTVCLVNRRGLGKAKHVDMQNLWIQEASKSKRIVTKKVGTNVNPADLMTKALPGPKIVQLVKIIGDEFVGQHLQRGGLHYLVSSQQLAE